MAFQGFLKEDTATTIKLGPFTDITDGVTYEVGMAAAMNDANAGVRISKNGGALAARTTATEPVYDAFGYYLVNLDATDTGTSGRLKIIFGAAATCLPCEADFEIVNANVFDSLFAAATTDYLQVDALQIAGTTQTATDLKDFADTGYDPATHKVAGVVLADTATTLTNAPSDSTGVTTLLTDWNNGGRLDLILDIIAADTTTDIPALIAAAQTVIDLIENIVRNKMVVTEATGDTILYADDGTTPLFTVAALLTSAAGVTTRKRLA